MSEDPANADFHQALQLLQLGSTVAARELLKGVVLTCPRHAPSHHLLGVTHYYLGDVASAIAAYQQAITLRPDYVEAYSNLGIALNDQKRYVESVIAYQQAIALKPDYAEAYSNLGVSLNNLNRHAEAATACRKTIALKPDYAAAHYNLGIALNALKQHREAIASFQQALSLAPNHAQGFYNLGLALNSVNLHEQAATAYLEAIALKPDYVAAQWNRCLVLLALGQFKRGWPDYEIRWKLPDKKALPEAILPVWLGDKEITRKKLLIQCEQGFGDAIQMLRYVILLESRGVECWIHAPKLLPRLIARSFPTVNVLSTDDKKYPVPLDYRIPIMSLPLAMQTFSEMAIPTPAPYLMADAARVAYWREQLSTPLRKNVGLVWRGSPEHTNDQNRSATLSDLLPLIMAHPSIQFVTLQKNVTEAECIVLKGFDNVRMLDAELVDFDETAAVMISLDVTITIDSAPAHLSGALGKTTWIILPFNADWRWLIDRSDSPWYPTAKLFRQKSDGAWSDVLGDISLALADFV